MNTLKVVAILFSFVYFFCTLMWVIANRGSSVYDGTPLWLFVSLYLLWYSYRICEKKRLTHGVYIFTGLAVCITGVALMPFWIDAVHARRYAVKQEAIHNATTVSNVHEEILLSEKNNPIGIRLQYTVDIPSPGMSLQKPIILDTQNQERFDVAAFTTNPASQEGYVHTSGSYAVTVDLIPSFLRRGASNNTLCATFYTGEEEWLKKAPQQRFMIRIPGTNWGEHRYLDTAVSYGYFYDTVATEHILACTNQ
jgi:hypothetical protein